MSMNNTTTTTGTEVAATTTVMLTNPWSKVTVERDVAEIAGKLQQYPWPDDVVNALDGRFDTDAEWVVAAVEMMGVDQAGIVIIGS